MPVLGHPHSKKSVSWSSVPPMFQFVPIASGPVAGHHWKEPGSISFAPSLQVFIDIEKIPLSLLQAEQFQLSQPFFIGEVLQHLHHLCGPLLDSLQSVHVSVVLRSPELDTALQVWPHQRWGEELRESWSCIFYWSLSFLFFALPPGLFEDNSLTYN